MANTKKIMAELQNTKRNLSGAEKGEIGEELAMSVVKSYNKVFTNKTRTHTLLYSSYKYPYHPNTPGNLKFVDGKFEEFSQDHYIDEIDILYITQYRIFVIEVKARSGTFTFKNNWSYKGTKPEEKCSIAQNEKHCRMLYRYLYYAIPEGMSEYIIPITVFVDTVTLKDQRESKNKELYKLAILNTLRQCIIDNNIPYPSNTPKLLNLIDIKRILEKIKE